MRRGYAWNRRIAHIWTLPGRCGRLFHVATAWLSIWIAVTIGCSGCRHENAQQHPSLAESQQLTDGVRENQQKANDPHRKQECIEWLIKHKVLFDLFITMDPDYQENPVRWHEKYFDKCGGASLVDPTIRDEDVRYLSLLPNLGMVYLSTDTTKISVAGLRHLKSCQNLEGVTISGDRTIPAQWVGTLASLGIIKGWCFLAPVTDDSVRALQDSDVVQDLSFANATSLTADGYGFVASLPNLTNLDITVLRSLGDVELHPVTRCRNLRRLGIVVLQGGLDISAEMAEQLASLPRLQVLELESSSTFPENVLVALGKGKYETLIFSCPASRDRAKKENKNLMEVSREMIDEAMTVQRQRQSH